jgi:hypothetical protein
LFFITTALVVCPDTETEEQVVTRDLVACR